MQDSSTTYINSFEIASTSANKPKIRRPINCFMAYRLEKSREIMSRSPGLNHRDISKIIAKWWKEATEAEKAPYRAIAAKAKLDHAKKYPTYKYQPVKKSERKVRPYRRRQNTSTYEQKVKNHILRQWLGEDDDEEMDCKSETSSFSSSSISTCSVNTQSFASNVSIKLEPVQMDDPSFCSSSSFYQPMFHENRTHGYASHNYALPSTQNIPQNHTGIDFATLQYVEVPNFVNLPMLLMNESQFMQ